MASIKKILRWKNYGAYAIVYVQLEDGLEDVEVYIGGSVEAYHDHGKNKAWVKKARTIPGHDHP